MIIPFTVPVLHCKIQKFESVDFQKTNLKIVSHLTTKTNQ